MIEIYKYQELNSSGQTIDALVYNDTTNWEQTVCVNRLIAYAFRCRYELC